MSKAALKDKEIDGGVIVLSSDTDEEKTADLSPKSKREMRRARLLRANYFRQDDGNAREKSGDEAGTSARSIRHVTFDLPQSKPERRHQPNETDFLSENAESEM